MQPSTTTEILTIDAQRIESASHRWPRLSITDRIDLIRQIRDNLSTYSAEWVSSCSEAKSLATSSQKSEEILTGPVGVARYLLILTQILSSLARDGVVSFPGQTKQLDDGTLTVPVFPARGVYDPLLFMGLSARAWMKPGVTHSEIHGDKLDPILNPQPTAPVALVLGAGNLSAIPITDSLGMLFQESKVVILKLSPVNEYLRDVFEKILAPLIEPGFLTIVTGDKVIGEQLVNSDLVSTVHITGSQATHDTIVWGTSCKSERPSQPILNKTITSELGNVSPWIIVPAEYSKRQLKKQAMNIASAMTNNSAFNCVTTRVIVTSKSWPQRESFLKLLQQYLSEIKTRVPYYPGTLSRYEEFTGSVPQLTEEGTLPWKLIENYSYENDSKLLSEESFIPVGIEVALPSSDAVSHLDQSVNFCNERLYGTLAAAITLTPKFERQNQNVLIQKIHQLEYATVCINQWPGLAYGLMTPPWGGAPGADLEDAKSGLGCVHNLYMLDNFEKTVFRGPLCIDPKPVWYPTHKKADEVGWKLLKLYTNPSPVYLPSLFASALLG